MFDYALARPLTLLECREMDRTARAAGPVALGFDGNFYFLRYRDVAELLNRPRTRTGAGTGWLEAQGITQGLLLEWWGNFLPALDPPKHTRLRSLVGRAFTVRRAEAVRPLARKVAEEALDSLPLDADFDVFADFASRIPLRAICSLLGVDDANVADIGRWLNDVSAALLAHGGMSPAQRAAAEHALEQLYAFVDAGVTRPGDHLLSALAIAEQDGSRLSRAELRAMVVGLLFTGNDTTRTLIALSLLLLAEHPQELAKLHGDPELAPLAVDEIMRFGAPAPWAARIATERIEQAGVVVEPGAPFYLSLAAANRDPEYVSEPERFDIQRREAPHLGFGRGAHFCLGQALARAEVEEVLRGLVARGMRFAPVGTPSRWVRATGLLTPVEPPRLRAEA